MSWSAEQYIKRIVVVVAKETGQRVEHIATSSFALTLWTYAELVAIYEEESVRRMGERTDLAGMVAVAFHQPQDLQKMEARYLAAAGRLSKMMDDARERLSKLMLTHTHLKPVSKDDVV